MGRVGNKRSGARPEVAIEVTPKERKRLEQVCRSRTAPYREVIRARALLRAAEGQGTEGRVTDCVGARSPEIEACEPRQAGRAPRGRW